MVFSNRSIPLGAAICAVLVIGACNTSTMPTADSGAGASGIGGAAGATGGQPGGAGGAAGDGGDVDAGSCRQQGDSCVAPQRCCGGLICAGICTTPRKQRDGGKWRHRWKRRGWLGGSRWDRRRWNWRRQRFRRQSRNGRRGWRFSLSGRGRAGMIVRERD